VDYLANFKDLASGQWWVIVVAIVVIYLASKIAKKIIKWLVIIGVIAFLFHYGTNYKAFVSDVKAKAWSIAEDYAYKNMSKNIGQATYTANTDGTFTVKSSDVTVNGAAKSDKLKVTYKGVTFEVDKTTFLRRYIEDVQQQ
jgi:hypothetical protein